MRQNCVTRVESLDVFGKNNERSTLNVLISDCVYRCTVTIVHLSDVERGG